ncbi:MULTISPECIES: hypothetical protein [unclassified Microbacterium]|uniref:hypothetical protein n=1 Tax=unclassified Microbacterium TaxID=2609290 RepID=UPI000EAA5E86|nr:MULTISPECIES: hypothetical protein [unclassified Microbacterium]MBT2484884.1 hypothetical protein [Microbacterium sp. ISL-108]RKN67752.1 hypothetical protein D7252_09210 [Microbacterium sp. CGR2]
MVALLVSLRWRQLRHQLSRNPWMIVTLVITGMIALGFLAGLTAGLVALRFAAPDAAVVALVLTGTVIVLGWWIGSILVSADDSLAPERFALLPVTARTLLPGFAVAGATTIGGIGTTVALLLMLLGWSVSLSALLTALIMIPVAVLTCVLGARVVSGVLAGWLARRSTRDLVVTLGVVLAASSGLLLNLGIGALGNVTDLGGGFALIADIAAWTPVGAVFGVPASVAQGDLSTAALRLLIALATVGVLWFAAQRLLAARLVSPIQSSGGGRVRSGGVLDRLLPASPAGAIAARSLRYFRRDPRQVVNIVMLLLFPAIFVGLALMNGLQDASTGFGPGMVLIPTVNALLTGTIVQMAIAYDNDAIAAHAIAGVSGAADRAGRLLGFGVIALPVTVALCVITCLLAGRPDLIPASIGAALGLTAIAAGAGAWVGSFLPGRAPAPEANPFGRGSSGGVQSLLAMIIVGPVTLVLGAPALGFAIAAIWNPALGWVSLVCGIVLGALALWGGTVLGGRILDRRWPEVLADVSSEG